MTDAELDEVLRDIRAIERHLARQRLARDRELARQPTLVVHEVDALFRRGRVPVVRLARA